jgi:hypothetical protein
MFYSDNKNFDFDLKFGKVGEKKLNAILEGKKFEVKRDRKAHGTGNVSVEYECRGKKSGISTTKAEWWAFIVHEGNSDRKIILIEIEKLKAITRDFYKRKGYEPSGDNKKSKCVLIPMQSLLQG